MLDCTKDEFEMWKVYDTDSGEVFGYKDNPEFAWMQAAEGLFETLEKIKELATPCGD